MGLSEKRLPKNLGVHHCFPITTAMYLPCLIGTAHGINTAISARAHWAIKWNLWTRGPLPIGVVEPGARNLMLIGRCFRSHTS